MVFRAEWKEPVGRLEFGPECDSPGGVLMARVAKFTDEQKFEIALELISGRVSHSEVCRKYDISSTYAYKLKERALDIVGLGIGRPAGRADPPEDRLRKRVTDVEVLAGDQALAIRLLKKRHDPA